MLMKGKGRGKRVKGISGRLELGQDPAHHSIKIVMYNLKRKPVTCCMCMLDLLYFVTTRVTCLETD